MTTPDPITTARKALTILYRNAYDWPDEIKAARDAITAALDHAEKLQSALSVTHEEGQTEIARLEIEVEKLKAENERITGGRDNALAEASRLVIERESISSQLEKLTAERDELKAAKWDVKHVDTMNDMVAMGLARDAAYAEVEKLKAENDRLHKSCTDWEKATERYEAEIAHWNKRFDELSDDKGRLTSQLEQAERVIAPFAAEEKNWSPKWPDDKLASCRLYGSGCDHCGADPDMDTPPSFPVSALRAASQWIKDRQAKGEAS